MHTRWVTGDPSRIPPSKAPLPVPALSPLTFPEPLGAPTTGRALTDRGAQGLAGGSAVAAQCGAGPDRFVLNTVVHSRGLEFN